MNSLLVTAVQTYLGTRRLGTRRGLALGNPKHCPHVCISSKGTAIRYYYILLSYDIGKIEMERDYEYETSWGKIKVVGKII